MKLISLIFPFSLLSYPLGPGFLGNVFPEPRIEYSPKTYVCHKAETSILVDGKLNDKAWSDVKWTALLLILKGV